MTDESTAYNTLTIVFCVFLLMLQFSLHVRQIKDAYGKVSRKRRSGVLHVVRF